MFYTREIVLFTILLCLNTVFAQTNPIGYIAELGCTSTEHISDEKAFKLIRYGNLESVKLFQDIYSGDKLIVGNPRCFMVLQLSGKRIHIGSPQGKSFYAVQSIKESYSLSEWFRQVYKTIISGPEPDSMSAVAR